MILSNDDDLFCKVITLELMNNIVNKSDKCKACLKVYRKSDKYKAYQKVYQKVYYQKHKKLKLNVKAERR